MLLQQFPLVEIRDLLLITFMRINEYRHIQVSLRTDQRYEGGHSSSTSHGSNRPVGTQTDPAPCFKKRRHGLQVQQVRRALDDQAVRADEQRLVNFVTKGTLKREQTVWSGIEDLGDDVCPLLCIRQSIRCLFDAQVLNNADPLKARRVNHERGMGRVDELVMRLELLLEVAKKVRLSFRVEG